MNRQLAGALAGLALLGGAPVAAGRALAANDPATVATTTPEVETDDSLPDEPANDDTMDRAEARRERLTAVLQPLVDDATITQAQADAVIEALDAAQPKPGKADGRHRRSHRRGGGHPAAPAAGNDTDSDDTEDAPEDSTTPTSPTVPE